MPKTPLTWDQIRKGERAEKLPYTAAHTPSKPLNS